VTRAARHLELDGMRARIIRFMTASPTGAVARYRSARTIPLGGR
jgi:hypothetical protein